MQLKVLAGFASPEASLPGPSHALPTCVRPGASSGSTLPLVIGATLDSGPLQRAPSRGIIAFKVLSKYGLNQRS